MSWKRAIRALGGLAGRKRSKRSARGDGEAPRTFFIGIGDRPMRLTVSAQTPDAVLAAIDAEEHPLRKASGALQLRGLARVNGQLVALHDVEGARAAEGQPEEHEAISS